MANDHHLKVLNQGVDSWNAWREESPHIKPDLSQSDLKNKDLSGIDLSFSNLQSINLSDTDLTNANLERANLKNGYLEGISLGEACLSYADLEGADLVRAFMIFSNLEGANLKKADLAMAILSSAVLDNAILDDAQLYETQRSNWSIKDIRCNRVFWDSEGKIPTEYYPGEFERLHGQTIKISIKYNGGINEFEYFTLPLFIKHINDIYPDCPIELESINTIPGKSTEAIIAVYDTSKRNPDELLNELERLSKQIPIMQSRLANYRDSGLLMRGMYKQLKDDFKNLLTELPNMSNDTYNIHGGNQAVVGRKGNASNLVQISNEPLQNQQLSEAVCEIKKLLNQLDTDNPNVSEAEKISYISQETSPDIKHKVTATLKAAGDAVLDEYFENSSLLRIVKSTVRTWMSYKD